MSATAGAGGRGYIGTMTALPKYDDESYLDFVEGLRVFAIKQLNPVASAAMHSHLPAPSTEAFAIKNLEEVGDPIPVISVRNRILSSTQGMNWNRIVESYSLRRQELENEMSLAEKNGPGTLEWNPNFEYPQYFTVVEYHRQPGGYHQDPLGGHIYHYGTKVFHGGSNDLDEAKEARIWDLPLPADGKMNNFLDFACSIGAGTVTAKERWPEANIVGIDIASPLLRYAHMRASKKNTNVHFKQMLAEDLKFGDASFDLAYMATLLHEVPFALGRKALQEAYRVLRPGGVLVITDMKQATDPVDPWSDYDRHFDSIFNNEPYAYEFVHSGVDKFLTSLFSKVETKVGHLTTWTCTK